MAEAPATDAGVASEPERLHGVAVTRSAGQRVLRVDRDQYLSLVKALKADGFAMCADLCAVDYLTHAGHDGDRFEVVVNLISHEPAERIRVRVGLPADDPTIPTLYELYPGTEAMEREAYDLFGITFRGHPDMTRILMPDDWEGHPLRKDYAAGRIPVQFKGAPQPR